MRWAGAFSEGSGHSAPFSSFFGAAWVGSPPSHITLARYVVQWDVMSGVGYPEELANLRSWYEQALALQLTPELALDNYNCDGCVAPRQTAEYTGELAALLRSFPAIKIVEAWNEPNDSHYSSYVAPVAAAGFTNAAYAFCEGYGCTVIAGDLLDSEPNLVAYEQAYERELVPRDPGNWGIHPYHAVKYTSTSTVSSFRDALPSPTGDRIWFTEVGAYDCEHGHAYGEHAQERQARFLVDGLIPEFQPAHIFYYELAGGYDGPPACDSEQDDTALYAARTSNGPLLARAAAKVIFGFGQAPSASASFTSEAQPAPRGYLACEPTLDAQWQRGECLYLKELFQA